MNKRGIKKILSFLPLVIGGIIIWGLASGRIEDAVNPKDKVTEKDTTIDKVYKNGRLQLKESYKWITEPDAEEYASDYKEPGIEKYGLTVNQNEWENQCYSELNSYIKKCELTDKQKGENRYNKDYIVQINEEFDLKFLHLKGKVTNIEIRNNVNDDEIDGFIRCGKEDITEYLDSDGSLKDMTVVEKYMSDDNKIVEEKNQHKMCFIKLSITLDSYSDWVQNSTITPYVMYLEDNGEALQPIGTDFNKGYYFYGVASEMYGAPLYYDVDFYDNYKFPEQIIFQYPMMNGESISFNVGYIVPEDMLDNVYFMYGTGTTTEFDYCNYFNVIIKAK